MKIEVDVLRAEQSWDLATNRQQNYLVISVFGIETRVPCSEQQLVNAISSVQDVNFDPNAEDADDEFLPPVNETEVRRAPSTFVTSEEPVQAPAPPQATTPKSQPAAPGRRLAPMQRPRGDDVGIAQG